MIKANVIIGHYQWKKKIKNPTNYFKSKLRKILKIPYFKTKKHEFSIFLTKCHGLRSQKLLKNRNTQHRFVHYYLKSMLNFL